jgi:hypothetical protein
VWLFLCLSAPLTKATEAADYSKEAAVIEKLENQCRFGNDGGRHCEQRAVVRVQSEAAVRQYGVLSFGYSAQS